MGTSWISKKWGILEKEGGGGGGMTPLTNYGTWKVMRDFPVTNTRVFLVRHNTSSLKWFLGVGKWTGSPSSSNSISSQGINHLCHHKSFRKLTSTCAHAAKASLSLAGLQNFLKRLCSSFSKNVLPQLAGPQMKMFLSFPLPDVHLEDLIGTSSPSALTLQHLFLQGVVVNYVHFWYVCSV